MLSEAVEGAQFDIPDPVTSDINPDFVARELKTLIEEGSSKIISLAESLSFKS
jgi:hypothetical protein